MIFAKLRRSSQMKNLRLKCCMNWEERDAMKLKSSWIYQAINTLSPRAAAWIYLIILSCIMIWRMPA